MRVVITGASGKAGQATIRHFVDAGYDVVATDVAPRPEGYNGLFYRADLTQFGEAMDVLTGADAVVHLANIPADRIYSDSHTLNTNLLMNNNVFVAAWKLKLKKVVYASSETTLGLPFDEVRYVPVDEDHYPIPNSTYSLSKVMTETMAEQISRWSGIPFVGLRFSNIFTLKDYEMVRSFWDNPDARKWNLFGYIDARDVAASCEQALVAETTGAESAIIAADDIILRIPTMEALKQIHPDVEIRKELGEFETLLSNQKAKDVIGFSPKYSWRDEITD